MALHGSQAFTKWVSILLIQQNNINKLMQSSKDVVICQLEEFSVVYRSRSTFRCSQKQPLNVFLINITTSHVHVRFISGSF